jgi:hypothetical protein
VPSLGTLIAPLFSLVDSHRRILDDLQDWINTQNYSYGVFNECASIWDGLQKKIEEDMKNYGLGRSVTIASAPEQITDLTGYATHNAIKVEDLTIANEDLGTKIAELSGLLNDHGQALGSIQSWISKVGSSEECASILKDLRERTAKYEDMLRR